MANIGEVWVSDQNYQLSLGFHLYFICPYSPESCPSQSLSHPGITEWSTCRYVNTINLQIDVTKFLHRYTENLEAVVTVLRTSQSSVEKQRPATIDAPPTLFGSTRMKAEVANLVLLAGNNVNDGFGLAFRIIQVKIFLSLQSGCLNESEWRSP